MQLMQTAGQNVLAYCNAIKFEVIFGFEMRPMFAILGLVLCLFAARAGGLPVIKDSEGEDSEAVQYVGKNVEVRGFVVSVTTSPLGTAFINFGREYPNQTFAGLMAAVSKIATDQLIVALQGKIIGLTRTIDLDLGQPQIDHTL